MTPLVGQILLNQYRVESFIAAGGMGAVYRVWDMQRNVWLAMKVLHSDLADDPSAFKLFRREATALEKLAHPNIVPFYGIHQSDDLVFLLERFVEGQSLKELLRYNNQKPLSIEDSLIYLKALSAALGYSHTQNVVHCDVKPGNVLVDEGGNIYLTDFGIARHAGSTTTTIGIAGAPAYMAPEQIRGQPVTPATDVYATGVMLFEMLTGKRPFLGDERETEKVGGTTGERIRYAQLTLPPPNPRHINPSISEAFSQVILKALEKDPRQRFTRMGEILFAASSAAGVSPTNIPDRVPQIDISARSNEPVPESREGELPGDLNSQTSSEDKQPLIRQLSSRLSGKSLVLIFGGIVIVILLALFAFTNISLPTAIPLASGIEPTTLMPEAATLFTQNTTEVGLIYTITPSSTLTNSDPGKSPTASSTSKASSATSTAHLIATSFPTPVSKILISGCAPSRLKVGDWAYVSFGGGPNFLRIDPDVHPANNILGSAPEGEPMEVINGPQCSYGWMLWEVITAHGLRGWTAESDGNEFFLIPGITWKVCSNASPSRLLEQNRAMVSLYPEMPNNIRMNPNTTAADVGEAESGKVLEILDGPECQGGYVWWRVRVIGEDLSGWTAEGDRSIYWLVPLPEENR